MYLDRRAFQTATKSKSRWETSRRSIILLMALLT